jgi:hypothetical protein
VDIAPKRNLVIMDTDDLSIEAYEGVLIEAEKLTHDLSLHYGLLASDCKNEADYLTKAEKLSRELLQVEAWELDDLFWGNPPDTDKLNATLQKIIKNIEKIKKIPIENRHYD